MFTKFLLIFLSSCLLLHSSMATVSTERTHHRGTPPSTTSTTSSTIHAHSSAPTHVSLTTVTNDKHEKTATDSSNDHHHHDHDHHHHDHSDHTEHHSHSTPFEDNFYGHFKKVLLALQDFHYLTFSTLESAQFFFTNVIAHVSETHEKTDQLKMKLKELTKYVTKVDRFRHSVKLMDDFTQMLDNFNATAKEKPSAEDLIIDGSMRKLKLEVMEHNFAHGFNAYAKRLAKELESFEKSLVSKEEAKDSDIKAWVVEIKDLTKKLESFGNYFDKQSSGMHEEVKSKA